MPTYSPAAMKRIERQRQEAEMLRKLGLTGDSGAGMVGRHYVVGNNLGNIAQTIAGSYMLNKANSESAAQESAMERDAQDWIKSAPNRSSTTFGTMLPRSVGGSPVAPSAPPAPPTAPAPAPTLWDQFGNTQSDTSDNQRIAEGTFDQGDMTRKMIATGKAPAVMPSAPPLGEVGGMPVPEQKPPSLLNKALGLPSIVDPDREANRGRAEAGDELTAMQIMRGEKPQPMDIDVYGGQPPRNPATVGDMSPGYVPPSGTAPTEQPVGLQQSPMAGGQQSIAPSLDRDAAAAGMQKQDYLQWLLQGMQNPQTAESAKTLLAGYVAEQKISSLPSDARNFMFRQGLSPEEQKMFDAMGGGKDDMAIIRYNKMIELDDNPNNPFQGPLNQRQLLFSAGYRPFAQVDTGNAKNIIAPGTNQVVGSFPMQVRPENIPEQRGAVAAAETVGRMDATKPKEMRSDFKTADKALSDVANLLTTLNDVKGSDLNAITGPIAGTEMAQKLHSANSSGAMALSRLASLKGQVATIGRSLASQEGKLGNMAVQEWKIVADSLANLDTTKGDRAVLEQLATLEGRVMAFIQSVQRAYQANYGETLPLESLDERRAQIEAARKQSMLPKTTGGR